MKNAESKTTALRATKSRNLSAIDDSNVNQNTEDREPVSDRKDDLNSPARRQVASKSVQWNECAVEKRIPQDDSVCATILP